METDLKKLQDTLQYHFHDMHLLGCALTHSSYANEHPEREPEHNERLEFLGDAVLELASSDYIYRHYPDMPEGRMTKLRASLVCESSLAESARAISLQSHLHLGHGEERTGGRNRDSVISDAMEALNGAVYLDGGFEAARKIVETFVLYDLENRRLFYDSKTVLQEILQRDHSVETIRYELTGEEGPAHAKTFHVQVKAGDEVLGSGEGATKKAAQQQAAYKAIKKLESTRNGSCI